MANYTCTARTNYVEVADMDGLVDYIGKGFPIRVAEKGGLIALFPETDDGDFPSEVPVADGDGDNGGDCIEFSWDVVMRFVAPNQPLIVMHVGSMRSRYLVGLAYSYMRHADGGIEHGPCIDLDFIYEQVAAHFHKPLTRAEY